MTAVNPRDELDRLVGGLCNGTLAENERGRLDDLLCHDHQARRFYNDYMFLHAELYSQNSYRDDELCTLIAADVLADGDDEPQPTRSQRGLSRFAWLAVAVSLLAVATASSLATYSLIATASPDPAALAEAGAEPAAAQPVARITATRNCLWTVPAEGVGFGSELVAGQQLRLAAGLAEITFQDGAKVVLEGPAAFDVRDAGQAELFEGRLAAVVPEQARGFAVSTGRLNVVDLGTEFGLMANADGDSEVHVFSGLVKAQVLDREGRQVRTLELTASEAARIQATPAMVAMIPARDDQFVRTLSVASGPHDGLYAYDGFNYPSGPMSDQNGGFGWAGPWFNIAAGGPPEANTNGVAIGSLEYAGMVPLGNRAVQTAQQNRIRRSLSTSVGGVFDAAGLVENQDGVRLIGRDGMTVYLSFLQRVSKTDDVFYGLELHRGDGNFNRVLCIGNGAEQCGYGVTSNYNVCGLQNFPALGEENTDVNLFVVKITFGPGNRDRVEVFRNPKSLVDETGCVADAVLDGNFAFDRIGLGNFDGTKIHELDEIRVGTTFLAVTGRRSRGPDRLTPSIAQLKPGTAPTTTETASRSAGWSGQTPRETLGWLPLAWLTY